MSLRQIAKELGISAAYLSYMLNGKRPWRKDLYQRYMGVVNSAVVGEETRLEVGEGISPSQEEKSMERAMGFEPTTPYTPCRCPAGLGHAVIRACIGD